jgi:beta-glucanase (GH16 family)
MSGKFCLPLFIFAASGQSFATAASLLGPVTFGSPDQPWGMRRAITAADRAAIDGYRSRSRPPAYSTTFTDTAAFQADWTIAQDDNSDPNSRSCRRSASVKISAAGLKLETMPIAGCHNPWATGHVASKRKFGYGFYEARMEVADVPGLNNAFWLTTDDHYEIDITEAQFPNYIHYALQYWPTASNEKHAGMGWGARFNDNLSAGFHDIGMLWTAKDIVFEIDGEPVAAVQTNGAVKGPAVVRFSTLVGDWAGKVPPHPEGHGMSVKWLHIYTP